jgi:hypothetical protein
MLAGHMVEADRAATVSEPRPTKDRHGERDLSRRQPGLGTRDLRVMRRQTTS